MAEVIALVDYGAGNLHSVENALKRVGAKVKVTADPDVLRAADRIVLPGVGSFNACASGLRAEKGVIEAMRERVFVGGAPFLGICVGMQLLFEYSEEGDGRGLGIIKGHVRRLRARRVPQMGWNSVEPTTKDPLFDDRREWVAYYANSYVAEPSDLSTIIARTTYESDRFAAAVRRRQTWGVQFHPEKSSRDGLRLLSGFLQEAAR